LGDGEETFEHIVNHFWDVSHNLLEEYEGDDVEEIHLSQNYYNTRSKGLPTTSYSPSTYEPIKKTSVPINSTSTMTNPSSSFSLTDLEYDFVEDMKKTRANISLI
jgi:hypothetical protein